MKSTVKISLLLIPIMLFSLPASAFDVGGFVNGVIEGVSDSYKDAKGKAGAHEKGEKQEGKSDESSASEEKASDN
ncbi:MAG: hypothetical protein ABW170_17625 [Candidatus Thiodiazotropha sp. L084R]